MTLPLVLYLLLIHWVADFLCQSSWMATNKWNNSIALVTHTLIYSVVITFFMIFLLNLTLINLFVFGSVTFVAHTLTDRITAPMTHLRFTRKEGEDIHWGFVIIGFDQWLHFVQVIDPSGQG